MENIPEETVDRKDFPAAGFWKRILAIVIDSIVIVIIGNLLALFFSEQFSQIGIWGRFIGSIITILYFSILNSYVGRGQTLGKKLMHIRVVNKDGEYISLGKAFLRSVILFSPPFLNGAMMPPSITFSPIGILISIILFGIGGSIVYFYIFNKETRQSLHDIICDTYVVRSGTESLPIAPKIPQIHYIVFTTLLACLFIFLTFINPQLRKRGIYPTLKTIQKQLLQRKDISFTTVAVGTFSGRKYLRINLFCKKSL